jgi:hypothetical protein
LTPDRARRCRKKGSFRAALAETQAHLTLAAAALHLYRLQQGHYPEGWDALLPDYLDQAPEDPFRAAPLIYRRANGGYLLYSGGPDGDDDGGVALPWQNLEAPADGDLVWEKF